MQWYPILKQIHVATALLSLLGFVLRGWWMWRGSRLLGLKPTRVLPHVVDTVLLASAVGLLFAIGQYPGSHDWLTAKVAALLLYILLGTLALKRGRTRRVRRLSFVLALATFGYIVGVALQRDPASWLASWL